MKDLITISAALIASYAVFMMVIVVFGKLFFPFYTKEQLEKQNAFVAPKQMNKQKAMARKAIAQLKLKQDITLHGAYSKLVRG